MGVSDDMVPRPNKRGGVQDAEDDASRAKFESAGGCAIPPKKGWHLTQMFEAMERRELTCLYVLGENPAQSEADSRRATQLLSGLDFIVAQDIFLTKTAQLADVVLPATAAWCESEGTVTNSERRVQRVRRAVPPPSGARDDIEIVCALSRRLGRDLGDPTPEQIWDEVRSLSPMHAGMSYARLEEHDGLRWPCYDEQHPGEAFLHARLWERPVKGPRAPVHSVEHRAPADPLSDDFPIRPTTGRRLPEYNLSLIHN